MNSQFWYGHKDLLHFLLRRKSKCRRCPAVAEQAATGNLHYIIQVLIPKAEKSDSKCCRTFLAGALGLEPRAYGFGDRRSTN